MRRTAATVLECSAELPDFDFASADEWNVIALWKGLPCARFRTPSPGPIASRALGEALLTRHGDPEAIYAALIAWLEGRLGIPPPPPPTALTCSLVICTHQRPEHIRDALQALTLLDPAPLEVIVVDNDPGEVDCRAQVEGAEARYVLEPRRGLDHARNAGIRAARGDIVAFTDDDCVPSPGWLRGMPALFAAPHVAGVTGPAFPYELDTRVRWRLEEQASLTRGMRRVTWDWMRLAPVRASSIGAGANMAFRRVCLLDLGPEPFPPELDAGTVTESGGDFYVLAKLVAAGWRIVYDPASFVFHQHRTSWEALHRAVIGYGVGMSAGLTKLLRDDGELEAPLAWWWLVSQYMLTQCRRMLGRADGVAVRVSWDYLRGGLLGANRWRLSRAAQDPEGAQPTVESSPPQVGSSVLAAEKPQGAQPPQISVVVPTTRRPETLAACLRALARQDVAPGVLEVVLVDDANGGDLRAALAGDVPEGLRLQVLSGAGSGAAAARNLGAEAARGRVLLFLDDDLVAAPDLVRRHLDHHDADTPRVVVGACPPAPPIRGLLSSAIAFWWEDFLARLASAGASTFVGVLSGNASIPRATFLELGGFDVRFERLRREDWEWGVRVLRAGVPVEHDPTAVAEHRFTVSVSRHLASVYAEGRGDALMLDREPDLLPSLPGALHRPPRLRRPLRWIGFRMLASLALTPGFARGLDVLEALRIRTAWRRVFERAERVTYARGLRDGGFDRARWREPRPRELDLDVDDPVAPPGAIPPVLALHHVGREVARVAPEGGHWDRAFAERLAYAVPWPVVQELADRRGWVPERSEQHDLASRCEVVLGPAHARTTGRHAEALAAHGARITFAGSDPLRHWDAVARALGEAERELVAIPFPGAAPTPLWLDDALVALTGPDVMACVGGAAGRTPFPLSLHRRGSARRPYAPLGAAPLYLVVRRDAALRTGGLDPTLARLGAVAPVLDLLERLLRDDGVVGYRLARGLGTPSPVEQASRERHQDRAWGGILALRAAEGDTEARRALRAGAVLGPPVLAWRLLHRRRNGVARAGYVAAGALAARRGSG